MKKLLDDTRSTYDAVADRYAEEYAHDLDEKPFDRALLRALVEESRRHHPGPSSFLGDLGCGPGFEARFLAEQGAQVVGIDLSPGMVAEATRRHGAVAGLRFQEGSLQALPFRTGELAGGLSMYSIIHTAPEDLGIIFDELARVLAPRAPLLVSFHVSGPDNEPGSVRRLARWWDREVALSGYFLSPGAVLSGLDRAGFDLSARLDRGPSTAHEFPSQRCYLFLSRRP